MTKLSPILEFGMLVGVPTFTEIDGWLGDGPRVHLGQTDQGFAIEFKVEGLLSESACIGAEQLAAMQANNPSKIRFGLKVETGGVGVFLYSDEMEIARIGSMPGLLGAIFVKNWESLVLSNILEAEKFQIGISFAKNEIDRNMIMEGGELVDEMPEKEFNDLLSAIKGALDQTVYVVKIGLLAKKDLSQISLLLPLADR